MEGSFDWPPLDDLSREELAEHCRQYRDTIEQMNAKLFRYAQRAEAAGVDVMDPS